MIYEGRRATCTFKPPDADGTVRVVWEITRRCNMLCRHCCTDAQLIGRRGDGQSDELRPEQTLAWLIEGRASEVYISGGEPLMVRELPATVGALLESGARVTVATNGRLVPVRLPDLPADVGFLVSLDSPDAVEYERVRRGGRLSDVLRALEALASEGRKFHLSCPLHPELVHNLSRIDELVELGRRYSATAVLFSRLVGVGRESSPGRQNAQRLQALDGELERRAITHIEDLSQRHAGEIWVSHPRLHSPDSAPVPLWGCPGGRGILHVAADGSVGPCSYGVKAVPESSLGSVRVDTVAQIRARWEDSWFAQRLRTWLTEIEKDCSACSLASDCGRGCPLFGRGGPFTGRDTECQVGSACEAGLMRSGNL